MGYGFKALASSQRALPSSALAQRATRCPSDMNQRSGAAAVMRRVQRRPPRARRSQKPTAYGRALRGDPPQATAAFRSCLMARGWRCLSRHGLRLLPLSVRDVVGFRPCRWCCYATRGGHSRGPCMTTSRLVHFTVKSAMVSGDARQSFDRPVTRLRPPPLRGTQWFAAAARGSCLTTSRLICLDAVSL